MGTQLILNEKEFDALDILVSREGDNLSFEQLYEAVWKNADDADKRGSASDALRRLIDQVAEAGEGFMRIDYTPSEGYSFKTHWGHNWQAERHQEDTFFLPAGVLTLPAKKNKQSGKMVAALFCGLAAAAAAIVLIFASVINDFTAGTQIIEADQVPLAIPDRLLLDACMEPGGCLNEDECTGEGDCAADADAEAEGAQAESPPGGGT